MIEMAPDQWLICVGLVFDIIGVVLLYRYGLSNKLPESGTVIVWPNGETEEDKKRIERAKRRMIFFSRTGIFLLVSGFILQIIGTLLIG